MNQTNQKLPKCSDLRNRAKNEKNCTCLVGGRRLHVPAAAESAAPARRRRPAGPWGRRAVWLWPRAPRRRWRRWGRRKGHSLASLGGDSARPREAATAASAAWLRAPPAGRGWILRRKWGDRGVRVPGESD